MRLNLFCLLLILGGFNRAFAGTLTVNFSSTSQIISNSAVLNMTNTQLRPPYKVKGWDLNGSAPPPQNKNFDVGDGSLGVFDNTTYNNFDQDGDPSNNIIQLNTNDYPNGYSFSQFTLDAGITLKPEGSQPLILKVLGDVSVSGTIDCSGNSGEAINVSSSLNATTGGVGRCGRLQC